MIGYLKGFVVERSEKSLILAAGGKDLPQGGVGYRVFCPSGVLAEASVGQMEELFIHTAVSENETLLTVSGIGPKMGLEILSSPLPMVQRAILEGDVATLTRIKGLGKKTAERLIVELRGKMAPLPSGSGENSGAVDEEAILALESLGFERFHILRTMAQLPPEIKNTKDIIKFALRQSA